MEFKDNLAKLRTDAGETQGQLAEILGISNRTISKWECGENEPDLALLKKLAEHYQVTLDKLCGLADNRGESDYSGLSASEAAIMAYTDTLRCIQKLANRYDAIAFADDVGVGGKERERFSGPDHTVPPHIMDESCHATGVFTSRIYSLFVNSEQNNFAVTVMRNAENFKWMTEQAEKISEIFSYLADPDVLRLLHTILTYGFPQNFTAEYAAGASGVSVEKVNAFLEYAGCYFDADLLEGKRRIYNHIDAIISGSWMALICIACELANKGGGNYDGYFKSLYNPIITEQED